MYKTINYCDNLIEYWGPALCIYIVPGILFVWAMVHMASRNPKIQVQSNEPQAGFFKQCLWILIAMFGGVFVVDKTTHEQFKRHRIVQKAIGVWLVLVSIIAIVYGENQFAFRNAYEMAVKNNTMEIYSGDTQLRAFPSYELHLLLSRIKKFLSFLGVAMYMWCYKSSPTNVWFKVRKVIGLLMLYFAYTALVVVYTPFDLMVFGVIFLLAILLLIDYRKKDKRNVIIETTEEVVSFMPIPLEESETSLNEISNSDMEQNSLVDKVKEMGNDERQPIVEQESLVLESDNKNIQASPSSKPQSERQALMKKILRYVIIAIGTIGIIIGIVLGIIYIVDEYIPERKLDKAVDEIIYNFEYGNKDTKRIYAEWILSINHEWKYNGVPDHSIEMRLYDYHKKTFDYVESMAYKGDKDCQFLLGNFYLDGMIEGIYWENFPRYYTKLDCYKSTYWYKEAALQNHSRACYKLGFAYEFGVGVEENNIKAAYWYKKSAELGDADGQFSYGILWQYGFYLDGNFVKDIEQAKFWWRKAAAQGNKTAKDRLQKIYE